jgi:type I restriction enzyme M protein
MPQIGDGHPKIARVFSGTEVKYGVSLFTPQELDVVEKLIVERDDRLFITCQKRDRLIVAKPEEIVRQLWIYRLLTDYGYPKQRLDVEKIVYFGSRVEPGAADIVIYHQNLQDYYILFETKRPSRTAGLDQLKSYCNAEGAPIGVWSNGNEMIRLHREEPNIFTEIPRLPQVSETLRDILTERWTIRWLDEHDELRHGKTTLKKIILDLEELVLGNAGVDPFEEIFKLVYAKLYDEWRGINDPSYQLSFYVGDRSAQEVKEAISNLLRGAIRTWSGVFEPTDKIELRDDHLKICISFLEKIKLFNSNLQVIDEAFEYLIPQVSKKKEGQFFTPRPVVDMVVKMLNPKPHEFVVDPACGSAGFLLHSVMWVAGGAITGRELPQPAKNFAQDNIYGIDFSSKPVKIAKAINLIVGDGKSHIYKDNSLAPQSWTIYTRSGLKAKLSRFPDETEKDSENQNDFLYFDFDVLMTNPPFAGTVKEREILRIYALAEKNGRFVGKTGRHILFLNRSLQFIRPGGRMAIVLPQGLLNNANTEYIRRYVIDEARILAVVGLHGNTFKPHTGTKTSVLFLQKHSAEERQLIQEIKAKHETKWVEYISKLHDQFRDVDWDKSVEEDKIPAELKAFIETFFETTEGLEEETEETNEENEPAHQEEQASSNTFEHEIRQLADLLQDKERSVKDAPSEKKRELIKEIRGLKAQIGQLHRQLSEKTLGGQIWLILNDGKTRELFRKFWLDSEVVHERDYRIFFAVNQKPLKDESGEYRYMRSASGDVIPDGQGHPMIEHDLEQISEAFVQFATEQGYYFWRR